jgi:DinB superfamily
MAKIESALGESRQVAEQLISDAESLGPAWGTPRAPGKWSPSQIVEHIARALDGTVALAHGQPSSFPKLPVLVHPLLRIVFRRLLNARSWPKGKTTRAMNPDTGPPTPAEGRARLQAAHARYEAACREVAARGALIRTPMFGAVPIEDFVQFMAQHMRHHWRQLPIRRDSAA